MWGSKVRSIDHCIWSLATPLRDVLPPLAMLLLYTLYSFIGVQSRPVTATAFRRHIGPASRFLDPSSVEGRGRARECEREEDIVTFYK